VLIHAVCDALLGAAALGDIGRHFPDTDPKYRDADSRTLLRAGRAESARAGYGIANVDATVIAEAPKLAPHIPAMVANLAADLGVGAREVNVKAKTAEKLGALAAAKASPRRRSRCSFRGEAVLSRSGRARSPARGWSAGARRCTSAAAAGARRPTTCTSRSRSSATSRTRASRKWTRRWIGSSRGASCSPSNRPALEEERHRLAGTSAAPPELESLAADLRAGLAPPASPSIPAVRRARHAGSRRARPGGDARRRSDPWPVTASRSSLGAGSGRSALRGAAYPERLTAHFSRPIALFTEKG